MWHCHKCSKPVYFAERKQSLGYDWHPECLRCEECGKRLNPGQHAEHKGVPYCHVPCYGALFGPQLFGHGTRVESHKSFGKGAATRAVNHAHCPYPREQVELKLRQYNECFDNKSHEIRSREVNGRLVLEGALRIYWGVHAVIHLKEDDDQRTVVTVRKRNSVRYSNSTDLSSEKSLLVQAPSLRDCIDINDTGIEISTSSLMDGSDTMDISMTESISFDTCSVNEEMPSLASNPSSKEVSPEHKSLTLPSKLNDLKNVERDELDDLLQVERKVNDGDKLYQTLPSPLSSQSSPENEHPSSMTNNGSEKTDSEYKTAPVETSDESTLTGKSSDEYVTPMNTMKSVDFEDFKKQICSEFLQNTSELAKSNDGTLKAHQPIDPSRINDSLKLYSENIMSKSFSGDASPRIISPAVPYQTLRSDRSESSVSNRSYALKKSDSTTVSSTSDDASFASAESNINRSRSGPNWYRNGNSSRSTTYDVDSDEDTPTLRPSTIKKRSINIKMDCYDELSNGVNSTSCDSTTATSTQTTTTPTSPQDEEFLYYSPTGDGEDDDVGVVVLRKPKAGSTAIKRRSGNKRSRAKLKRRCSINGHFYNRETSFFTPPHGSQMSVWITSLANTNEVISLLLEKYKVDSRPENFALFIVRDNGEQKRLRDDEYPLLVRTMLGPHEDVARIFLTDAHTTTEISSEVAQFLNLSVQECRSILDRYEEEREREQRKVIEKYSELKRRIVQRMESLKVRL